MTRGNARTHPLFLTLVPVLAVALALAVVAFSHRQPGGVTIATAPTAATELGTQSGPATLQVAASQPAARAAGRAHSVTLTPLAHTTLGDAGFHADVWGHKDFAYVGTWGSRAACPASGVKVVDLSDPTQPRWVSTVAAIPGTSQEDIVVRSVSTAAFTGDLLAVGIQSCQRGGAAGLALFDVTDPRNPVELGFYESGAGGVHELDLVQQGDRVLALLAVPDAEAISGRIGDFRIVDVSNPRRPVQLAHWGAQAGLGIDLRGGIGCSHRIYDHSARASADGRRAYLSYWDAGVIVLDISEPTAPRVIGQFTYPPDEEGSTHSVAEFADGRYLLVADEDFFRSPYSLRLQVQTADGPRQVHGCEATFSRELDSTGVIEGSLVDGGRACPGNSLPADVRGQVVLVADGGCSVLEKATRVATAGGRAMIIGVQGEPVALGGGGRAAIPVIAVAEADAAALRQAAPAPITLPGDRRWPGLRIWDIGDLANPRQVATYHSPGSLQFPPPSSGYYSVHNAEVVGDLAFISWFADGVRVLDISDPADPREVAGYVPPPAANPQSVIMPDATLVWGVYVLGDLVLISDINSGLHILRYAVDP